MREVAAHEAVLVMDPDADMRARGAAVTVALCGHCDHQPPCPLAPHQSRADRVDGEVRVRVLLATEPDIEWIVRRCIDLAPVRWATAGPGQHHHGVAAARKPAQRRLGRRG